MADRAQQATHAQHSQAAPSTLAAWEDTRLETRPMPPSPLIDARRRFDVCHVGLVLRAVLGVQLVQGLGLAMAQATLVGWVWAMGTATVASMTAVLSWLLIVCGSKRLLSRLPQWAQWTLPIALGAACAHGGTELLVFVGLDAVTPLQRVGAAGFGALGAGLLLFWLMLRERAQAPAEALARLVELQSRIRPHFLFNTLNTAIALVRVDPSRAEEVLEDLAELFRVALADTGPRTEGVPLAQEVDLAKRYLAIEQLRFGERLRVDWQVDPYGNDTRVPPLLLQPLVENAVRHGVEPNDQGGDVSITTRVRGSEVEIRVVNTVGAPARTRGHGLALKNVKQRLRLMHDVAARIEVAPSPTRFMVRILLPR
ncbi:histidine kinase [Roseateles sp. SL47]|uniref:sensor histidine kinase n=1 Tax=Roseateles sp. SL47 TaxID=2995138 RepID=UPI00226E41D4|nr:histidine kinase [Roseateles sp. SL47]WAC75279.1 histidine kinase [Roseateles sp. SL47]